MLNRGALIVRPKQPYIDWASGLDDSGLVPEFEGEKTAYLIPSFEDDAEGEAVLKQVFAEVFERELEGWHTDEADWPKKRTFAMFKQWSILSCIRWSKIYAPMSYSKKMTSNNALQRTVENRGPRLAAARSSWPAG